MKKIMIVSALAAAGLVAGAALAQDGGESGAGDWRGGRWEKLDANGDGKITQEEMDAREKSFFAAADANGDGAVTKDEMRALHEKKRGEMAAKMLGDANGDGSVSRKEYDAQAAERFAKLDANKDGVLSPAEIENAHHGPYGKHRRH